MQKLGLLAFIFCLILLENVAAQSVEQEAPVRDTGAIGYEVQEIPFDELPETVQTGFQDSDYAQWEITQVIEHPTDEGIIYEITVSDGTVEETVRFDENGEMKSTE